MSLVFVLTSVLTGFLIVRLAWPNAFRVCRHDVLRLSMGAGLGLGLSSLVAFIADAVLGGGAAVVITADLAMLAATAAAYAALHRVSPCPLCARPQSQAGFVVSCAAAVSMVTAAVAFGLFTSANPLGEWDAWAIWNNHARFLASGASWKQMFSPHLGWAVQDYPLLVPGAIANAWMAAGSTDRLTPAVISAIFLFASAGVVFGTLEILRGRKQAFIGIVMLFGGATVIRMAASQYADVPLAFFYATCIAMVVVADAVPGDRHSWWLAGAAAGCAAWTKNEGMVFLAVVMGARLLTLLRTRRFEPKPLAVMLAGAAPFVAALVWFKTAFAPANYLFTEQQQPLGARLADISRYMTVAVEFGRQAFTFGGWLLPPVLVLAGYFWLMGKSASGGTGRTTGLISVCAMLAAYAGVYCVTTKDLNWQIETSLSRVLMQLWPMAVLVYLLYVREVKDAPEIQGKTEARSKVKATTGRRVAEPPGRRS